MRWNKSIIGAAASFHGKSIFGLVGLGTGWWTWRTSLAIMPVKYLVDAWTEIKRGRELQRKILAEERAQLEVVMQVSAGCRRTE
jgi:hypothetical protein